MKITDKEIEMASDSFEEHVKSRDMQVGYYVRQETWIAATIASEKKHRDNIAGIINQIKIRDKEILDLQKEREEMKEALIDLYESNLVTIPHLKCKHAKLIEKLKDEK
jgi:hypothetical protein